MVQNISNARDWGVISNNEGVELIYCTHITYSVHITHDCKHKFACLEVLLLCQDIFQTEKALIFLQALS
jgi:hypothetical protein